MASWAQTVGSELKDEGEKFEELEMQRILEKDPDALPYYNAQKQLSLARAKVVVVLSSFMRIVEEQPATEVGE